MYFCLAEQLELLKEGAQQAVLLDGQRLTKDSIEVTLNKGNKLKILVAKSDNPDPAVLCCGRGCFITA